MIIIWKGGGHEAQLPDHLKNSQNNKTIRECGRFNQIESLSIIRLRTSIHSGDICDSSRSTNLITDNISLYVVRSSCDIRKLPINRPRRFPHTAVRIARPQSISRKGKRALANSLVLYDIDTEIRKIFNAYLIIQSCSVLSLE